MHDSAIRINNISRLVEARKEQGQHNLYSLSLNEYQSIISENKVNHEDIDFSIAKAEVNKDKGIIYTYRKYISQYYGLIPYYLITFVSFSTVFSILSKVVLRVC